MKFTANPHKGFLNSEILLTSSSSETIQVYCERTNMTYTLSPNEVKRIRFDKSGVYVLQCEDWEEKVIIEDAIRLGGSEFRNIFTFDANPWVLLSMKDRTYFYNRKTKEQYYENDIAPEIVLEVNKEYLLFGNKRNKDYALYSTEQRKIVKYLENVLLYKDMYIVYEKDDVLRLLYIYDGLKQESYKAKNYKLYDEQEILAFVNENDELCHYFLRTETLCVSPIKEKFISFLSTPHVVLYDGSAYYNILVKSLLDKKQYKIHLSTPIANCCGVSMIGDAQDDLAFLISCREKDDNIRKLVNIEKILLHNEQVFILKRYYEYNSRNNSQGYLSTGIYTLEDSSSNILVHFSSGEYPTFIQKQKEDKLLITTSKRLIYFDPGISLQIPNAQLISSSDDIFYSKEENAKSHLFKLYNIRTNISATQISKEYVSYGIVKVGDEFIDFMSNKRLKFSSAKIVDDSLILYNDESTISYLYLDHILYRIDEEYYNHPESYQLPQQKKAPTVQGQYKAAIREGLLDPSVTEEQFVEILLDKHMRKAYFDNSNKIIPNAYGDYDSFCKGVDRVLAAYKIRTNTPTKKTPTVQGQYELAKENGLLHKSITQEGFAEFLKDATKRKEYYDYVQNKKPGFYSEWETFNNNVDVMLANYKPNTTPQPTVTTNTTTTYKEERMVYICTGPSSYRYHRRKSCRGLNRCSGDIERVTVSEARDLDRTPCGYCY